MKEAPTIAPSSESASESRRDDTSELIGNETTPGKNCDARSFTGTNKLNRIPSPSPVKVMRSGSNLVSASVKIRPNSRKARAQYLSVARVVPKYHEHARKRTAVRTSTVR